MMTDMNDEESQRGVSPNMYLDPLFEATAASTWLFGGHRSVSLSSVEMEPD